MKYQSGYIFYELSLKYEGHATAYSYDDQYGRAIYYEPGKQYSRQLIITNENNYIECIRQCDGCAIIINAPVTIIEISDNKIYIISEQVPMYRLFNTITDICNRFDQWDEHLHKITSSCLSYDDLYHSTDTIMTQGFSLFDTSFQFVSLSEKIIQESDLLSYIVTIDKEGHQMMPLDNLLAYAQSQEFIKNEQSHGIFLIRFPKPCFNINIFYKNKRVGLTSLKYSDNELENHHNCAILIHLAKYVEKLYTYYHGFFVVRSQHLEREEHLRALISRKITDTTSSGNRSYDNYFYLLDRSKDSPLNMYIIYLCNYLENLIPQSFCFEYDNRIAILVECNEKEHQAAEKNLSRFLYDNNLIAATTKSFQNLSFIAIAYEQSVIALNMLSENSGQRIFSFYDCALRFITNHCLQTFKVNDICAPQILTLQKYDSTHQTELTKTLKVYLQTHLNATESARQLYIHRSSLLSRLDRIVHLTSIDFEDYNTRLYLEVSFQLIDSANI